MLVKSLLCHSTPLYYKFYAVVYSVGDLFCVGIELMTKQRQFLALCLGSLQVTMPPHRVIHLSHSVSISPRKCFDPLCLW